MVPYSQYLADCASSLAVDPQFPSDPYLLYYVGSMHVAEQVAQTFDHGCNGKVAEMNDDKIHVLVKALEKQLDDWTASLPITVSQDG